MKLKNIINIRISDETFKRLKLTIAQEEMTISEIIRRILHQYMKENPQSVISKSTGKTGE